MLLSPAGNQITLYPYHLASGVVIQNALAPLTHPASLSCAVILHKCTLCSLLLPSLALQIAAHCVRCASRSHMCECVDTLGFKFFLVTMSCQALFWGRLLVNMSGHVIFFFFFFACDTHAQGIKVTVKISVEIFLTYPDFLATITNQQSASANPWPVGCFHMILSSGSLIALFFSRDVFCSWA